MYKERDLQLDMYRGLVMIFIICWIHVLYWLSIPLPYKGFFLVEMPIIFFIAGASSVLASHKSEKQIIKNRFERVFVPYYKYAVVSLFIFGLYEIFFHDRIIISNLKQIIKIILGIDLPGVKFVYHTWFILPYFIISIIPKKFENLTGGGITIALIITLDIIEFLFPDMIAKKGNTYMILKEIMAYNLFYIGGRLFYHKLKERTIALIFVCSIVIFTLLWPVYPHDMQVNKFPPNTFFVVYNIAVLSLLSLLLSNIKIPKLKIIDKWNKLGYGLYLYQNYYFIICTVISGYCLQPFDVPILVQLVAYILIIWILSNLFATIIICK